MCGRVDRRHTLRQGEAETGAPGRPSLRMSIGCLQQAQHFSGLSVAAKRLLREQQRAVSLHLEATTAGLDQLDLGSGVRRTNLRRQTDGAGFVVSHDAEFDADVHGSLGSWRLDRPAPAKVAGTARP